MSVAHEIHAQLHHYPAKGGGRISGIVNGYRPLACLGDSFVSVSVTLCQAEQLAPGETTEVYLLVVSACGAIEQLKAGDTFTLHESPTRMVGEVTVISICPRDG